MKFSKTCLLLGNTKDTIKLKSVILKKKWKVFCSNKKVNLKNLKNIDLVITFNYRFILNKNILKKLKRPAINLHISYLPYNRGAHPNFWSFIENSPKGVTIHEIDEGLDTGPIIYQKKIFFDINKKINDNFHKTHQILILELKKLFLEKINQILNWKYKTMKQKNNGSFHYEKDLPLYIKKNWNLKIKKIVQKYKQDNKNTININTRRVFLKKLKTPDVRKDYLSWFKDKKTKQYIKKKISTIKQLKKYVKNQSKRKNTLFLGIFLKKRKIHIGNIKFEPVDKKNNFFWLGILIGKETYRGKGIGYEVVNKSSEWLFRQKKVHAIFLVVKKKNKIAVKLYKNCHFRVAKTLPATMEYLMVKKNPYIISNPIKKINSFKKI